MEDNKLRQQSQNNKAAVIACIVAVIMLAAILASSVFISNRSYIEREIQYAGSEAGVQTALAQISYILDLMIEQEENAAIADSYLAAVSARDSIRNGEINSPQLLDNGVMLLRAGEDGVEYPDGVPEIPEITPELLARGSGTVYSDITSDGRYSAAFSKAGKGYYAVRVVYASDYVDWQALSMMERIEDAFDAKALLLDRQGKVIYGNPDLDIEGYDFRGTYGPDEKAIEEFSGKYDPYLIKADVNDKKYSLLFVFSGKDVISDSLQVSLLIMIVAAVLLGVMIVWLFESRKALINNTVPPEHAKKYSPDIISKSIRSFGILASVIVIITGFFVNSVGNLYSVTWDAENALSSINSLVDEQGSLSDDVISRKNYNREQHARMIADILARHPEMRTGEQLAKFSEVLSANYIMIFDEDGNEVVTDSSYVNISIPEDKKSENYALRRVLKGEDVVAFSSESDMVTESKSYVAGVRLPAEGEDQTDGYNALVISYKTDAESVAETLDDPDTWIMSMVSTYNKYLLIDEEGKILMFGDSPVYGEQAVRLGMDETDIRDGFMGMFTLSNRNYYGLSRLIEGRYCYYAIPYEELYRGSLELGAAAMMLFVLAIVFIRMIMKKDLEQLYEGYSPDEYDKELAGGTTPEAKAKFLFRLLGGIGVLAVAIVAVSGIGDYRRDNLLRFIFTDYWNKGFNLFAFARIVIMVCIVAVIWQIVAFIIGVICNMLDAKGVTVARLIKNIFGYAVVFGVIYYAALYLGFEPSTLLASVGIIGLAISLGAKDIISDVFTGMSLVFEGTFEVGDTVDVDGTEGVVKEIGVRTLKLIDANNNIKTIRNSDIRKVINKSRHE